MAKGRASTIQTVKLNGTRYVIVPKEDYDALRKLARVGSQAADAPLPAADAKGLVPAAPYARASLARKIVRRRRVVGLTQRDLAKRAGLRPETLCRIEKGRITPAVRTVEKIARALDAAAKEPPEQNQLISNFTV